MLSEVDKRIIAGFIASFFLLIVTMVFSYRNMMRLKEIGNDVAHTHEVLYHIEQIYSQLLEIESNQRGYIIFSNPSFEQDYELNVGGISLSIDTLQSLVRDKQKQLSSIDTLRRLVEQKILFTRNAINARKASDPGIAELVGSLRGKRLTESILALTNRMKDVERGLLQERIGLANAASMQLYYIYIAFGFTIILIFISVLFVVRQRMKERLSAEEAIRQRSDEIRDLYHNAPCGYHSLDPNGNFIEVNHTFASWLGYSREEMLTKINFVDILPESEKAVYRESFQKFKEEGRVENIEFQLVRKNGTTFHVILSSSAIFDDKGNYLKDRATTFDISARKEAEEKARMLNNELEAFSYSVSHDLRAPLRSIDSYTKILAEEYADKLDEEGNRLIGVVVANASRMGQLIDDLLDFSRLGRKELIKSEFSMERLVKAVLDEMEADINGRKLALDLQVDVTGWADKSMLRQVWSNLISNALKYSSREPEQKIQIGHQLEGSSIVFFVKDNGVGFDMKYYERLFAVFQRLHSSKEFAGTGVGLALAQRIVSKHGGKIWAESEPDKGSTFYFSLPTNNERQI